MTSEGPFCIESGQLGRGLRTAFRWLWPEQHHDISDSRDQVTTSLFGELRRKLLLSVFEIVELHLHQFVLAQICIERGEELWAEAVFADLQRGFHPLRLCLQNADLRVGKLKHVFFRQ